MSRTFKIHAADNEHFISLIKDYRKDGFMLITLGENLAELEKNDELIVIEK